MKPLGMAGREPARKRLLLRIGRERRRLGVGVASGCTLFIVCVHILMAGVQKEDAAVNIIHEAKPRLMLNAGRPTIQYNAKQKQFPFLFLNCVKISVGKRLVLSGVRSHIRTGRYNVVPCHFGVPQFLQFHRSWNTRVIDSDDEVHCREVNKCRRVSRVGQNYAALRRCLLVYSDEKWLLCCQPRGAAQVAFAR